MYVWLLQVLLVGQLTVSYSQYVWDIRYQSNHNCAPLGTPLPDFIVDTSTLVRDIQISYQNFAPTDCDVVEGGFTPGLHKILRFSVSTPNIGDADLLIGDPCAFWSEGALFEYAPCHNHFHFKHYASYELIPLNKSVAGSSVITAQKQGFCMIDTTAFGSNRSPRYTSCGRPGRNDNGQPVCWGPGFVPGNQGLSVGWADTYNAMLQGQYFIIDNLTGPYRMKITVNPAFPLSLSGGSDQQQQCPPYTVRYRSYCFMLCEKDYTNNVAIVDLLL